MEKHRIKSTSDGLELSFIVTKPSCTPRGIMQLCHGMCEHKERYIQFMEFLTMDGWVCVLHDHRGHGESIRAKDDLGFMYEGGWKALVQDAHDITTWIKTNYPGLPIILFGHSMGSMVVRSYTKRWDNEIRGLYVCGCPSYNSASPVGRSLAWLLGLGNGGRKRPQILQDMSFGSFNKPFAAEGDNAWVVSDPDAKALYNADPLCQYHFTANGFQNLLALCMDCYSAKGWKMSNPTMPVRFISGGDDPCRISDRKIEKAVALMQKVGYGDVELTIYDGMRHEILNETGKAIVWRDVLDTIDGWVPAQH